MNKIKVIWEKNYEKYCKECIIYRDNTLKYRFGCVDLKPDWMLTRIIFDLE